MGGQLNEMRTGRLGGDKSMADQMAVMRDQAKAMQGQLDQMALAQRPWITTTEQKVNFPLVMGLNRAAVVVGFDLGVINTGHSPAFDIQMAPHLIAVGGGLQWKNSVEETQSGRRDACDEGSAGFRASETRSGGYIGPTAFPGEPITLHGSPSLVESEVTSHFLRKNGFTSADTAEPANSAAVARLTFFGALSKV